MTQQPNSVVPCYFKMSIGSRALSVNVTVNSAITRSRTSKWNASLSYKGVRQI